MIKKFFFDNIRDVPDTDWVLARDVPAAKSILSEMAYDIWSLDHDIGFQMMCEKCWDEWHTDGMVISTEEVLKKGCNHTENGTTLANWAIENVETWPDLIIIHSANPYGSARMRDILAVKAIVLIIAYDKETLRSIKRT